MTTPTTPVAVLTLTTDKQTYAPDDVLTLTAVYSDPEQGSQTLTITGTATDAQGNSVNATATVSVISTTDEPMTVTASDSFGDTYATSSDDGKSTVVFTTTVTPPASA
jgi:hypothetical protein